MSRLVLHHVLVACGLFALWVVLSGMLDAFHLILGALSSIAVSLLSARRLYTELRYDDGRVERQWLSFLPWHRVLFFFLTLGWEIVKSNLAVTKKVLGPISNLQPQVFDLDPDLHSELARVSLAYSVIITPGTTILDVTPEGHFIVHALDDGAARDVREGPLQPEVARVFEPPGFRDDPRRRVRR